MALEDDFDFKKSPEKTPQQWADIYRGVGLQPVPAHAPKGPDDHNWKYPMLATWRQFQNEQVPQAQHDRWFGEGGDHHGRKNMGILTGRCSRNLMVIDLDTYKTPSAGAWWDELIEAENYGIPLHTVEQRTGGGGLQKLFRCPAGWHIPTNKTSIGIDIRGQGGFVVTAPSMHESGRQYEWLPDCSPEDVEIAEAPPWLVEAVIALVEAHGGDKGSSPRGERTASPEGDYTAFGSRHEGRESEMRDKVWRTVLEAYRQDPTVPVGERYERVSREGYEIYERGTQTRLKDAKDKREGLEREGRGPSEWNRKFRREIRNWGSPRMAEAAARPNPNIGDGGFDPGEFEQKAEEQSKAQPQNVYEKLHAREILAMRDPEWAIAGLVAEQAMGFIYGPPGTLKTFIGLDIALSFASGLPQWWTRDINSKGAVVYISSEGQADLKLRLMAWGSERGVDVASVSFYLIREGINFMKVDDVGKLLATVQTVADETSQPISAVFVDTVSRVLPGADENLQKDMTLFIAACDALRHRFKAVVVGIHHTARAGNMRGSTVMPGAGDFIVEVERQPGAAGGLIRAVKIKAGQDGWEQPFVIKQVPVGVGAQSSLVVNPAAEQPKGASGWPERAVCIQILAGIDEQWMAGKPWCFAANSPRNAITNIVKRWQLKRSVAKDILDTWMANGVIEHTDYDRRNHIQGYRKLVDL